LYFVNLCVIIFKDTYAFYWMAAINLCKTGIEKKFKITHFNNSSIVMNIIVMGK